MATTTKNIFVRFKTNVSEFSRVMKMPMNQFKEMQNEAGGLDKRFKAMKTTGGKVASKFRFLTHGFRGFRMETKLANC